MKKLFLIIKRVLEDPQKVYKFIKKIISIYKRSSLCATLGYLSERVTGYNIYSELLKKTHGETLIKLKLKDIDNLYMYVDLSDEGISKDLFLFGKREENMTKIFKLYLKPGQNIIDIGSNIGYYVLIEASIVKPNGRIYALEPDPHNVKILRRNIEVNQYDNIVYIENAAVSNKTGVAQLHLANRSNLHTLTRVPEMDKYVKFKGSIEVPTFSLDDFLKFKNIDPRSIDVIRMDIEGHEVYALEGMRKTLKRAGPLILFIEIHPKLIKQDSNYTYESFLEALKNWGFKLKECFLSVTSRIDKRISVRNIEDLLHFNEALEVILVREE